MCVYCMVPYSSVTSKFISTTSAGDGIDAVADDNVSRSIMIGGFSC